MRDTAVHAEVHEAADGSAGGPVVVNGFARWRPAGGRGAARALLRLALLVGAPMPVAAAHNLRALARFDVRGQLAAVRRPTLVVAGACDRTVPLAAKRALARGIPGARLVVVPASGHATPMDRADAFNRLVLGFIAAH